jgi:sulfur carrier protein ThiS
MRVLFINNDGGGFADHIEIAAGTSVAELFRQRINDGKPDDYLIRVNRQSVSAEQILQEGDRISISPNKITGARSPA